MAGGFRGRVLLNARASSPADCDLALSGNTFNERSGRGNDGGPRYGCRPTELGGTPSNRGTISRDAMQKGPIEKPRIRVGVPSGNGLSKQC